MTIIIAVTVALLALVLSCFVGWRCRRAVRDLWMAIESIRRNAYQAENASNTELAALWGAIANRVVAEGGIVRFSAQHGEDFRIWRLADFKCDGFFVDIGAFDGLTFSNTYALEQLGWHGILVEANPTAVGQCRQYRPHSQVVHAAVGGSLADGTVPFHVVSGDQGVSMLSYVDGDQGHLARVSREGGATVVVPVSFRPLNNILLEHADHEPQFDLLSIDIEGAELDVLKGLDWKRWRPKIVVAESNSVELVGFMESVGYFVAGRTASNILFANRTPTLVATGSSVENR